MNLGIETWRDSIVFLAIAAFTGRLLLWLLTHDGWAETGPAPGGDALRAGDVARVLFQDPASPPPQPL